jgi:predicted RecB family nuclease
MTDFTITAYTLRHLYQCERRVWLDRHGDIALHEEVISERALIGVEHERKIGEVMFGAVTPVPVSSWAEMVQSTRELMAQGVAGIAGAAFERETILGDRIVTVRGRLDWLRKINQPSELGRWAYEPVEIKQRAELQDADRVQLDLYLWLLEEAQGAESTGWFWLGRDDDGTPLRVLEHIYSAERLDSVFARVAAVIDDSAPPIFLTAHCKLCGWYSACTQVANREHAFTLLPGLSQVTWEHMRQAGIRTVEDVAALSAEQLQKFKGVGKARSLEMLTSAQAMSAGQPVLRNPLPPLVRQPGVMLDLETRLDDGAVWCFGWLGADGRSQVAVVARHFDGDSLILPDGQTIHIIPDSDTGWRMVAEAAAQMPGPVYHWGGFEQNVLRATAPRDVIEALRDRLHDLNRTFRKSFALPLRSTSIKSVAPYFGFKWPEGTNALTAHDDYRAWLLDNDRVALARACAYNRADVEALDLVWRWMVDSKL